MIFQTPSDPLRNEPTGDRGPSASSRADRAVPEALGDVRGEQAGPHLRRRPGKWRPGGEMFLGKFEAYLLW
jgi:hypothetical protein